MWNIWNEEDLKVLDKQTYYLMQIACEIRRTISKNPKSVTVNDLELAFKRRGSHSKIKPKTVEEATTLAKARWGIY